MVCGPLYDESGPNKVALMSGFGCEIAGNAGYHELSVVEAVTGVNSGVSFAGLSVDAADADVIESGVANQPGLATGWCIGGQAGSAC